MLNSKQVIVMRRDLKMSKGKIGAQAAHASEAFITGHWQRVNEDPRQPVSFIYTPPAAQLAAFDHWLDKSFKKIVLWVDSERELLDLYHKVITTTSLMVERIDDSGLTEFNNVETLTCIGIGPAWDHEFLGLTDHLKSQ